FFANTPDINPYHLQGGERWMFMARLALAATLSGAYGIYNGYELLEHAAVPGKEEYLDSDKYEIKVRDWNAPGNIKDYITAINRMRRAHPALLQTTDVRFTAVAEPNVIGFVKEPTDHSDAVAGAIALARGPRHFWFQLCYLKVGPSGSRKR